MRRSLALVATLLSVPTALEAAGFSLSVGVRSFWTFDTFHDHAINFLWGPIITGDELVRSHLFDEMIPRGFSGNDVLYAILIVALLSYLLAGLRSRWQPWAMRRPFILLAVLVTGLWLTYDARMGLEVMRYAFADVRSYGLASVGERTLRDRGNLYDAIEQSTPLIAGEHRYGLASSWPIMGLMRYMTYPELPSANTAADIHTWFIYEDPTVHVDEHQRLLRGEEVLLQNGRVLKRFGEHSFLFQGS